MGWILLRAGARGFCLVALLLGGCGALWLLVREPCTDLVHSLATSGPGGVATLPFGQALTGLCACVVLLCSAWLAATTSLVVLVAIGQAAARAHTTADARAHPRRTATLHAAQVLASRLSPALAHRLVLAGCGIALGSGLGTGLAGSPAMADSRDAVDPNAAVSPGEVGGLDVPDRIVGVRNGSVTTTVTRGDSLWSISAKFLPSGATDTEITTVWHALHRTNRDLIGPDPDVIHPGTTLQVPPLDKHERKEHP